MFPKLPSLLALLSLLLIVSPAVARASTGEPLALPVATDIGFPVIERVTALEAPVIVVLGAEVQSPVVNPNRVSFTAPTDYDVLFADGTRRVVSLSLTFLDNGQPALVLNMGRPVKDASNVITSSFTKDATLAFDRNYTLVVTAINAYDSNTSDPSVPIVFSNTKPGKPGAPKPCQGNGQNACP